jgi:hypothetical protein
MAASQQDRKDQDRLHDKRGATEDAESKEQPSADPQLRKVHATAGMDDELGRGNETRVEDGGGRHRTQ